MLNRSPIRVRAASVAAAALLLLAQSRVGMAQQLEKFTVAVVTVSVAGPVFFAQERGYFKDAGLDVDLKIFGNGNNPPLAVAAGSADASMSSMTVALYNIAAKGGLKIIAGVSDERPHYHNNGFIVSNAAWDAGVRSLKDMKGHHVGITFPGGATEYDVGIAAQKYGYSLKDVTLVPLQSMTNQVAAFKGGQVEILSAPSPVPEQLAAQNYGHLIGWSGDETPWQAVAVYANAGAVKDRRPAVAKFLAALARGAKDYNVAFNSEDADFNAVKGPGYDDSKAILTKYLGAEVVKSLSVFPYVDPTLHLNTADIANQIKFWQGEGALAGPVDPAAIVDASFTK